MIDDLVDFDEVKEYHDYLVSDDWCFDDDIVARLCDSSDEEVLEQQWKGSFSLMNQMMLQLGL